MNKKDPSNLYIIHGLRGKIWFCEREDEIFLGNQSPLLFNSEKEAKAFMKTEKFKKLDWLVPCEWHITTIKEWNKIL